MHKNILNISDLNRNDLFKIIEYAGSLNVENQKILNNKHIGLIFEKYSTRTRLSFNIGIKDLGGDPIDIKFEELNIQRIESFEDTFKIFNLYLDAIVYRTSDHNKLTNASKYFNKPIINALSDISHPCQIISDLYTLKENFNFLEGLKISWLGDLNNVLFSLMEAVNLIPEIELNVFTSEKLHKNLINFPDTKNTNFLFDLDDNIIFNSHCIMTDVYNSMNDDVTINKDSLLKKFQVNEKLIEKTNDKCVFMHCLPANINSEVTKGVIEGNKSIVLKQAKNRLIAQKGILKWLEI